MKKTPKLVPMPGAEKLAKLKKEFAVNIRETLEMRVIVRAVSADDALRVAKRNWDRCEYELDSEHFTGVEFEIVDEEKTI